MNTKPTSNKAAQLLTDAQESVSSVNADNDPYQSIRPYNDDEVGAALNRLVNDNEFINAIIKFRFGRAYRWIKHIISPVVRVYLKIQLSKFRTVDDIQREVENYMGSMIKGTTDSLSFEGLDKLDPNQAYLFVSNHRDIAMDPALVNWGLYHAGHKTVRIAIGDNLLKMDCATELMKLNKSFIVKRSAKAPREMMKALGLLSSYIYDSLQTGNSIWIAQREGRAKDGRDLTDAAILKMFHVEGRKQKVAFGDYIKSLKMVPVSISYENDPCDFAKANELYQLETSGEYKKGQFEDITSIVQGISGKKKRVCIHFGDVITENFESAELLAAEIDRQIHTNYHLYPINYLAAQKMSLTEQEACRAQALMMRKIGDDMTTEDHEALESKLVGLPEKAQEKIINMYGNPVLMKTERA